MIELRERLKAERHKIFKPYFDLRRSIGTPADIQKLADYVYLPNLKMVDDECIVSVQLSEIRRYLLLLKIAVEKFDREKGLTVEE